MSFFAEIPESDLLPEEPEIRKIPAWVEPSSDELPVAVHLGRILARASGHVLSLRRADVYSSGVMFKFRLNSWFDSPVTSGRRDNVYRIVEQYAMGRGDDAQRLRLGLTLPGGVVVDTGLQSGYPSLEEEPANPLLSMRGGGGGGDPHGFVSSIGAWLWPLPEPGDATMHFSCEGLGMPEGSIEIDTRVLFEAAKSVLNVRL